MQVMSLRVLSLRDEITPNTLIVSRRIKRNANGHRVRTLGHDCGDQGNRAVHKCRCESGKLGHIHSDK